MPLYEYECGDCGQRFERIQKFSDPPVTVCPHCGGTVRKLLSSPAIQFKGSGFYITDYAKAASGSDGKGETKAAEATTSSTTAAGSASESKSKPAAATESKSSESPKKTETAKS